MVSGRVRRRVRDPRRRAGHRVRRGKKVKLPQANPVKIILVQRESLEIQIKRIQGVPPNNPRKRVRRHPVHLPNVGTLRGNLNQRSAARNGSLDNGGIRRILSRLKTPDQLSHRTGLAIALRALLEIRRKKSVPRTPRKRR